VRLWDMHSQVPQLLGQVPSQAVVQALPEPKAVTALLLAWEHSLLFTGGAALGAVGCHCCRGAAACRGRRACAACRGVAACRAGTAAASVAWLRCPPLAGAALLTHPPAPPPQATSAARCA
jgi:hypothetical protein